MLSFSEKRLAINYVRDDIVIRSRRDITRAFVTPVTRTEVEIASKLHKYYLIPNRDTPPRSILKYLYVGRDFYVLREFGHIVEAKSDLLGDWIRHKKALSQIANYIYRKGFCRYDIFNEDLLGLLDELAVIGTDYFRGKRLVFLTFGRRFDIKEIHKFLLGKEESLHGKIIRVGLQRRFQTELLLEHILTPKKREEKKQQVVPFISIIMNFLRDYRVIHFKKAERDIAILFEERGYSLRWLENGSFALLFSEELAPNNIIIQVAKKKIPTRGLLYYLRKKYRLKGSYVGIFICTGYLKKEIHQMILPNWYVIFWDPNKFGWSLYKKIKE